MKSTPGQYILEPQKGRAEAPRHRHWLAGAVLLILPLVSLTLRSAPGDAPTGAATTAGQAIVLVDNSSTNTCPGTNSLQPVIEWTDSGATNDLGSGLPRTSQRSWDKDPLSTVDHFGRTTRARLAGDISLDGEGGMLWNAARPVSMVAVPSFYDRSLPAAMHPVTDLTLSDSPRDKIPVGGWLSPLQADRASYRDTETAAASPSVSSPSLFADNLADVDHASGPQAETQRGEDLLFDAREMTAELTLSEAQAPDSRVALLPAYPEVLSLDVPPIPEAGPLPLALAGALLFVANSVLRRRSFGVGT